MRELITYSIATKAVPRPALVSNKGTAAVRYTNENGQRDRYNAMKAQIRGAAMAHLPPNWIPVSTAIELRIVIERSRLKSDPDRVFKLTAPDVFDNLAKGIADAHTELVWLDDKQVVSMLIGECYGDEDRITIQINEVDPVEDGVKYVWATAGPREGVTHA